MAKFTIFDCDNCISDDSWRIPMINWKVQDAFQRYHAYHLAAAYDAPGNLQLIRKLRAEEVIIFTAMPEHYRVLRQLWFNHNRIGFNRIYMRPAGDLTHSVSVKRNMLRKFYTDFGIDESNIACAYDDRQDVVDFYLSEGIRADVMAIHNVSAYKPPVLENS